MDTEPMFETFPCPKCGAARGSEDANCKKCGWRRILLLSTATDDDALPVQTRRRWYQFSLRTLLLFVLVVGMALGWLGSKVRTIRTELHAVAEIQRMGGRSIYGLSGFSGDGVISNFATRLKRPNAFDSWLRGLLGAGPYGVTNGVWLNDTKITDADLAIVKSLPDLELLILDNTNITDNGLVHLASRRKLQTSTMRNTRVTDAGLKHLVGLTMLDDLNIKGTEVTDRGIRQLQEALPDCKIWD